jgi:adenosine deaminase
MRRDARRAPYPTATVLQIRPLYNGLIDAFSMRNFVASEGESGQDHFFGAFTKFGGVDPSHTGEWLDEVAGRAAAQNMPYLELMATPTWNRLNFITKDVARREDLADLRQELLGKGLTEDIPDARQFWDDAEAKRHGADVMYEDRPYELLQRWPIGMCLLKSTSPATR